MRNLFKRKSKVDIEVIRTESLQKKIVENATPEGAGKNIEQVDDTGISINILGKQQLREELTSEELLAAAEQAAQELVEMTVPDIVKRAQRARKRWQLDTAILMLWQHRLQTKAPYKEIEEELAACYSALADNGYFQSVPNGQLATILFSAAGFTIADRAPIQKPQNSVETRLTVISEKAELSRTLETMANLPTIYHCYCLAEFDQALDDFNILNVLWHDFENRREIIVHPSLHFVVCKQSSPTANMYINVRRFENNQVTIPLERVEMRRAILNNTMTDYIQGKVAAWMDNHRLFATTLPVVREGEFFGREEDIRNISANIERGQSFYLIGLRRMGKTSLIQHLASIGAFRNQLYAYIELEDHIDRENFDQAIREILRQWSKQLESKFPEFATHILAKYSSDMTPYEQISNFLDGIRELRQEQRIDIPSLVTFDDANQFFLQPEEQDSLWKRGASRLIHRLHNQQLVSVALILWDLDTRASIERERGFGKYNSIPVRPLLRQDSDRMITYIGGIINMEFAEESLAEIYMETGGHPLWARTLCDAISSTRQSRSQKLIVTPQHVMKAAEDFIHLHEWLIKKSLDLLSGSEKRVLNRLALSDEPANPAERSSSVPPKVLANLEYYGLLTATNSEYGHYQLTMRLVNRYFQALQKSM